MRKALITGVTGQDGSYLAELLLEKGYEVHGLIRRTSMFNRGRIEHIIHNPEYSGRFITHYGDMTDGSSLMRVISICQPDEIYNLAAQSHVQVSFLAPEYTVESDAVGVLRLLEAVRSLGLSSRIYQASTSELYGETSEIIINESTIFNPVSPYAAAKIYAHYIANCYKKAYGLYVCNGIMFNHESPRRGENFVTRKITLSLAEILKGERDKLVLGNLDAVRDWGYAGDYAEAMWLMLQQNEPEDFVIATGECHSVREFAEAAFNLCGIEIQWIGKGVNEKGINQSTGRELICCSPIYYRPVEVPYLRGDHTKARTKLGWNPRVSFQQLIELMVYSDLIAHNIECPFTPSISEKGIGKNYRL